MGSEIAPSFPPRTVFGRRWAGAKRAGGIHGHGRGKGRGLPPLLKAKVRVLLPARLLFSKPPPCSEDFFFDFFFKNPPKIAQNHPKECKIFLAPKKVHFWAHFDDFSSSIHLPSPLLKPKVLPPLPDRFLPPSCRQLRCPSMARRGGFSRLWSRLG